MASIVNYSNPVKASIQLLKLLKVKVTTRSLINKLEEHPDFPSLLSIHDTFTQFSVNSHPIDAERSKLIDLPVPFIAHITSKGGNFVTVFEINKQHISYYENNKQQKPITSTIEEFNRIWTGKTLLANSNPTSGEKNYYNIKRKEFFNENRIHICLLCLLGFGLWASINQFWGDVISNQSVYFSITMLIYFIGIIITSMLLLFEVDSSNHLLKQICTAGQKTNCNAILNSKQARLFGWISWSEIGFYYYMGGFLSLIILDTKALPILASLGILALPYIIFSIYFQSRIAKQWCPLCLGIQITLFTGALMSYIFNVPIFKFSDLSSRTVLSFLCAYILPILIWSVLKPLLLQVKSLTPKSKELIRLKSDPTVFYSLLTKQKQIQISTNGMGLTIGNPESKYHLLKVCNPFCGPCADAHPKIEEILQSNPNVKVQIIFSAISAKRDKIGNPAKLLLAIYAKYGIHKTEMALHEWYSMKNKDYNTLLQKYPMEENLIALQQDAVDAMAKWCHDTDIQFTPTFFIQGYQLPEIYHLEEIKYLLT